MGRILVSKDGQRFIKFELLDMAVSSEISTRWAVINQVVLEEKALSASIISGRKMYLSQPECILRII